MTRAPPARAPNHAVPRIRNMTSLGWATPSLGHRNPWQRRCSIGQGHTSVAQQCAQGHAGTDVGAAGHSPALDDHRRGVHVASGRASGGGNPPGPPIRRSRAPDRRDISRTHRSWDFVQHLRGGLLQTWRYRAETADRQNRVFEPDAPQQNPQR